MHRRLFYGLSLSILGLSLAVSAHATPTPITAGTYNLAPDTSIIAGGVTYYFTGTVTLGSTGLLTGADITLHDANLTDPNPVFNTVTGAGGPAGYDPVADYGYVTFSETANGTSGQLYLSYLTTFDGSGDIDLCILSSSNCNSYQASSSQLSFQSAFGYSPVDLAGGAFDPAGAAAPEPSSLVLLTTGMIGLAGVVRRRVA